MLIQISFPWDDPDLEERSRILGHDVVRSRKVGLNPDFCLDMGNVGQPASMQLAPDRRGWCQTEPSGILNFDRWMPEIIELYPRLVMGWSPRLQGLDQFVVHNATSAWVKEWDMDTPKEFGISGFISSKRGASCPGYGIRQHILDRQDDISIPSMVWNHTGKWRGRTHEYPARRKDIGMNRMFHLAIENCSEKWYHTEKVLDAFMSMSVPLYWGDPMLGARFDMGGVILVDGDNIIDRINALSPELYRSMSVSIARNREIAEGYLDELTDKVGVILKTLSRPGTRT